MQFPPFFPCLSAALHGNQASRQPCTVLENSSGMRVMPLWISIDRFLCKCGVGLLLITLLRSDNPHPAILEPTPWTCMIRLLAALAKFMLLWCRRACAEGATAVCSLTLARRTFRNIALNGHVPSSTPIPSACCAVRWSAKRAPACLCL